MESSFFTRLKEFYAGIGHALAVRRDLTGILPNPTDKGLSRERAYAEVLRQLLPSSCQVALGGFVFSRDGVESRQMDVLVFSDMALRYCVSGEEMVPKTFTCIDGAVGVVSVKTTLDGQQIVDALDCMASLPEKMPLAGRVPKGITAPGYEDWPYKAVFAFGGLNADTIFEHVQEFYEVNPSIPYYLRPNIIHVLEKYCVVRIAPQGEKTRRGEALPANAFVCAPSDPDFLGLAKVILGMHQIAMAMRWMVTDYTEIFDKTPLPRKP